MNDDKDNHICLDDKLDPEILEANAKLSDPAVLQALLLDPQKTKIELFGALGFSMKATIVTELDGKPWKFFMKTRINETTDDLYFGKTQLLFASRCLEMN